MEIRTFDGSGNLVSTRVVADIPAVVNRDAIMAKARTALTANAAFLAITTPTNAQVVAQVKVLTRESTALIRLLLDELDSTAGT